MSRKDRALYGPDGARYCPECGTRVAQQADTCFFCGADLRRAPRRWTLPVAEGLAVLLIGALVWSWWRLPAAPAGAVTFTPTASPTATATPTSTFTPTPTPTPTATSTPTPTPTPRRYTVQPNDTLIGIAAEFGVKVETLAEANNLPPDAVLQVGQELIIPPPEGLPTPTPTPTSGPVVINYRVQQGDTLALIAEAFRVPVEVLVEANNLEDPQRLQPDMVLVIPLSPPQPTPTPTPFSTPTPTPGPRYPAPVPVLPPDGAVFEGEEARILLAWTAVGLLRPGERYVVTLQAGHRTWTLTTNQTSLRVPTAWYAAIRREGGRVRWRVQVVGTTPRSAASAWRVFVWR